KTLYRFDLQEQRLVDIEVLNYYVSTNPESPFLTRLMAARRTEDGRYALLDNRFSVYAANGCREQLDVHSVEELRGVLAHSFGIKLTTGAGLDVALARIVV